MMSQSIKQIEADIVDEFSMFEDWTDKYQYIIDLGKELAPLADQYKTDENKVRGCQSQVWLYAEIRNDKVIFEADSDAIIVKGLVSLLLRVLSNQTPQDIMDTQLGFINDIGMKEHLSPTRSNGLVAMIKQMKYYALAFKTKADA